ncbi:unnamed protein product, partial [Staurois parvus]
CLSLSVQCHLTVPVSAAYQCHLSVPSVPPHQCPSVPPISVHQCILSVPITTASLAYISEGDFFQWFLVCLRKKKTQR